MTNEEFAEFANRLFIAYPSLCEWLNRSSPDPIATQTLWRDTLRKCSLEECDAVLQKWQDSGQTPFEAYRRDQVAAIIRSVIFKDRDRAKAQWTSWNEAFLRRKQRRKNDEPQTLAMATSILAEDRGCLSAYQALLPYRRELLAGTLAADAYEAIAERILNEHIQ